MSRPIEDYALIGDTQAAGLVSRAGSLDWLCLPRFDSDALFAALLGDERHGRWAIAPTEEVREVRRRYRPGTLVLETEFITATGRLRLTDCMTPRHHLPDVVRSVFVEEGHVPVGMSLVIRPGYGSAVPWTRRVDDGYLAVAGPDAFILRTDAPVEVGRGDFSSGMDLSAGRRVDFHLAWFPSHERRPGPQDAQGLIRETEEWWRAWSDRFRHEGPYRDAVLRSLITLKALTYAPTGGIVAAPTTSLPERVGGVRNWDYRYCWVRDATFTLQALMRSGFEAEARAWHDWLLRAAAGAPDQLHILYGIAGERRLPEIELPWLPGYESSRPVRTGNAASTQFQLDVYGELLDCMHQARHAGVVEEEAVWEFQRAVVEHLETTWSQPDEGIWEVRGPRQHFTHSKVMAWVAFDRAIRAVETHGADGPIERWREIRARIHADVCDRGFDPALGAFTQHYGSRELDASLLMIPLVGFLPPGDPRVKGTVAAIQRSLCEDGLVLRYRTERHVDGLPPGEATFLPCSFWLVDNLALAGRRDEARSLFERLLDLRNDVGLLAEEYDPRARRQLGNFPQAFSHVSLVNSVQYLAGRRPR